jgi:predicted Fe-Mo cluster-binding NifX family protein
MPSNTILIALAEDNGDSSRLAFHLSASTHFALVKVDKAETKVLSKRIELSKIREANMLPAIYVASLGYKVVITRGMGPPALPPFRNAGVKVLTGSIKTLSEAIHAYLYDELVELDEKHDRLKHAHDLPRNE